MRVDSFAATRFRVVCIRVLSTAGRERGNANKLFVEPVSVPDLDHTTVRTSLLGETDKVSDSGFL